MKRQSPLALASSIASIIAVTLGAANQAHGQAIAIGGAGSYTENFDILGTANVAWVDGVTVPGWHAGINANATADGNAQAADGTVVFSGLLNLGLSGDGDRAIGSKATSTNGFANIGIGVLFQNTSGAALTISNLSFAGELWRTNTTAGNTEQSFAFFKTSNALFTDVEPGGSAATANTGSFTPLPGLNWNAPVNAPASTALNGNLAANRLVRTVTNTGIVVNPGDFVMIRWIDTNIGGTDGYQGIDDFSITFAPFVTARNLVYNLAHSAGGAPNGAIELTASQYWLDGGSPAAFLESDNIAFSQDGTANINVPVNVAAASVTVSANSGTYTIGGAGAISSSLSKSGTGTLALTSANAFNNVTLSGGTVITSNVAALGNGGLNMTGPVTLTTTTDLTTGGGINGTGALTKNGSGVLTVGGVGTGTGGVLVETGGLRSDGVAALGADTQLITLSDTTSLEFTGAAGAFSAAGASRVLVGNGTNTLTVGGTGNLEFNVADTLVSAGTFIKEGTGTLRTTQDQNLLQASWIVNAGNLELQTNGGLGTGDILMNGGILVVRGNPGVTLSNNVTLNGGALGTRSGDAGVVAGSVNVTGNSFINLKSNTTPANAQSITVSGPVSGNGDLTLTGNIPLTAGANKALILTNPTNTYSGNITATSQQTVASESVAGSGSTLGAATITLGGGGLRILDNGAGDNGTLAYGNNVVVIDPTDLGLPGVATITLDHAVGGASVGNTVAFGSLAMSSQTLNLNGLSNYQASFTSAAIGGAATINSNTAIEISGPITGTGSITKDGASAFEINGATDADVDFTINAGSLEGIGDIGGDVAINGGAAIGAGSGGTGILDIGGNLTLAIGSTVNVELADGLPGLNYDLINVGIGIGAVSTGSIDLGGATLSATANPDIDLGDLFFIFNNDGADPITGTFDGIADNSIITIGTQEFRISYDADFVSATLDGGNDVALLAVPEPGSAALLLLGAGILIRRRRQS
jgi:fibronectin-binding autotransporter adhesin